jgi:Zn-dependent alcohol dehydrogenase
MRIRAAETPASHQPASIEELDLDELRDDEILVQVAAAGIFHR